MVERPPRRENFVASYVRRDAEEQRPHGLHTAEYALVLGLVALVVVGIMLITADQLRSELDAVVAALAAASQ
jgi:Flp pilus assembly pilin Flp